MQRAAVRAAAAPRHAQSTLNERRRPAHACARTCATEATTPLESGHLISSTPVILGVSSSESEAAPLEAAAGAGAAAAASCAAAAATRNARRCCAAWACLWGWSARRAAAAGRATHVAAGWAATASPTLLLLATACMASKLLATCRAETGSSSERETGNVGPFAGLPGALKCSWVEV